MKGDAISLMSFLDGAYKRFVIPCYQRKYDWKTEHCAQLFNDLKKISSAQYGSHFFGSIVYSSETHGHITRYYIVDGQQRITTVMLLLLAIRNLVKSGEAQSDDQNLADKIDGFLIAPHEAEFKGIKLWPIDEDKDAFEKIIDGDETEFVKSSNITKNYEYFYKKISSEDITVDDLYNAIYMLEIIWISLENGDNPQRIFESINSTGMPLSEGDKIRNYILMGLDSNSQNMIFNDLWRRIEKSVSANESKDALSDFMRDYLSIKQQILPNKDRIYFEFKTYMENLSEQDSSADRVAFTESLLRDMLKYARLYEKLYTCKSGISGGIGREIDDSLFRLKWLNVDVIHSFLMEVLNICDEHVETGGDKISPSDVLKICAIIESYLSRRSMCGIPSNPHNRIFLTLNKDVLRFDGTTDNYVSKLAYVLLSKRGSGIFPRDDDFVEAVKKNDVYVMRPNYKEYLFERFENYGTSETKDVYNHYKRGHKDDSDTNAKYYSIEHIMPQRLTPAWNESLGDDSEEIHNTWLHRLANLTLTAYNSNLSNETFYKKKNAANGGYLHSGLRMNQRIAQKESWGRPELEERSVYMADQAKEIWKLPETDFAPEDRGNNYTSYTLAEDVDYTGLKVAGYFFMKTEKNVLSWTRLLEDIIKILYQRDESIILDLVDMDSADDILSGAFKSNKGALLKAMKIDDNVYVEKNTDTKSKIRMLRHLFDLYGIDQSELVIYLQD